MDFVIRVQDTPESRKLIDQLMAMNQARILSQRPKANGYSRPRDLTPYFNDQGKALDHYQYLPVGDAHIDTVDISIGESLHGN